MYEDYSQGTQGPTEEKIGFSVTSLVLGIVGLLAWCIPLFGYPITIAGLVFGILGIKRGGKVPGIIGIVLSAITLLLTLANSIIGAILAVNFAMFM